MTPHYQTPGVTLYQGDCVAVMAEMPECSVDTILTDPPYGLEFMGKEWDMVGGTEAQSFHHRWATAAYRIAKPGAMLLAFGGTRTWHRLAVGLEDAGWELRDTLMWLYAQGFPKSLNFGCRCNNGEQQRELHRAEICSVPKGISRDGSQGRLHHGAPAGHGEDFGASADTYGGGSPSGPQHAQQCAGESRTVRQQRRTQTGGGACKACGGLLNWDGWGTALKPSVEPVLVAQKPLGDEGQGETLGMLARVEAQLWSLLPAEIATSHFGLNQADFDAVSATAGWSAEKATNTRAALFGQMDTSPFVAVMTTCLSTVQSWRRILADASAGLSMSIIGTVTGQTTDWSTLKSCACKLTPNTIIRAATRIGGSWCDAVPAAAHLSAACRSIDSIRALSALAHATDKGLVERPDGVAEETLYRPILLAMKPTDGSFAENAAKHGVAGLHIDGGRIAGVEPHHNYGRTSGARSFVGNGPISITPASGRWPANVLLDQEAARLLDQQSGERKAGGSLRGGQYADIGYQGNGTHRDQFDGYQDAGGASRFFYVPKADRTERGDENSHPTVKPVELMKYLCLLTRTPTGGVVLDPFAGSGTTLWAAKECNRPVIGIEQSAEYCDIIASRLRQEVLPLEW